MICRCCPLFNPVTQEQTLDEFVRSFKLGKVLGACEFAGYPMFEDEECTVKQEYISQRDEIIKNKQEEPND